jgi:hypothetical protein
MPMPLKSSKLLANATPQDLSGAPHRLAGAHELEFNADMPAHLAGRPGRSPNAHRSGHWSNRLGGPPTETHEAWRLI